MHMLDHPRIRPGSHGGRYRLHVWRLSWEQCNMKGMMEIGIWQVSLPLDTEIVPGMMTFMTILSKTYVPANQQLQLILKPEFVAHQWVSLISRAADS